MFDLQLNFFALFIAAVLAMIIGAVWYSPLMFAKPWMKLSGVSPKDAERSDMKKTYGLMFVSTVVAAYVLAYFVKFLNVDSVIAGFVLGFWIWLGFVATTMLPSVLFENKPWKLYLINTGYQLAVLVVMGAVLAVWQ